MLEPGQIFASRYRVDRRIAEGGMGAIFEAEHMATERRVALKLLFPHIMSVASARKKFELEAKISARVNSPNIVEVLDAGFDEGTKSPFLVMELLHGQTLAQHVGERGPLTADQALALLVQVAAGLDAAHGYREPSGTRKPIVHRDLKPENLFMAREHGAHVVKILDFGIAKVLGETSNVSQEVRGTPLYMAFEQVTAGVLSPQTDLWALGLIAYYMVTGTHYWRAASNPSANVQSLFAEILSLPLEAPSVRSRQQNVNVELPAAFDAWLLDCIQRDPARRFASAGVAIDALAQVFGQSPRARARIDSTPVRSLGRAATEAFQAPAPAARAPLGTAASLPGITSERGPSHAPAPSPRPKARHAAIAAGGVLLLAGTGWLMLGGEPARPPPAAAGASALEVAPEPPPAATGTPADTKAASRAPVVAPAQDAPLGPSDAPRPEPAPTETTPPTVARAGSASAATQLEPQIRLAPRDDAAERAATGPSSPLPAAADPARDVPAPGAIPAPGRATVTTPSPAPVASPSATPPAPRAPAPSTPPPAASPTHAAPSKKPGKSSEAYKMR